MQLFGLVAVVSSDPDRMKSCLNHLVAATVLLWGGTMSHGQTPTVGVLFQSEQSYDGYTLMPVAASTNTYLLNNCGEEINRWTSEYKAGMMAYLLDDGSLIRAGRTNNPNFGAGGAGGILEMFDWEGDLTWSYPISSPTQCQHHDMAILPNGNVLTLVWKAYPASSWLDLGRDPEKTASEVWSMSIVEIEPQGSSGGNVVWEWESIHHLVQDFDPSLPNFGEPRNHPRQLDVNYQAEATDKDWLHTNSIAYNAELDQIMVSSRDFNELWIIDHSTPSDLVHTEDGHLLYRWGNPEAYGRGNTSDRVLHSQHDARWIQDGRVMVFSNGNERPDGFFSTVEIIAPPLNADGKYTLTSDAPWGPGMTEWRYPSALDPEFFSQNTSGAQQLPNGNILITEGASGEIREIDENEQVVWNYRNPIGAFGAATQGAPAPANMVFRAERYAAAHPGLAGRDLTAGTVLEITIETPSCVVFPEPSCPADFNGNYFVEVEDLLVMLTSFGCTTTCEGDIDGDGSVGIGDLLVLLSTVGSPCPS